MKHILASSLLMASVPAMADLRIFIGSENSFSEGGSLAVNKMAIFNNPPSCNDYENTQGYVQDPGNDATRGGYACDGCKDDENPKDWNVERLKLPHEHEYSEDINNPLTIYQGDDGEYGMYDKDMKFWGSCNRPDDPQYLECTTTGLYHIFHCDTDLTSMESGN